MAGEDDGLGRRWADGIRDEVREHGRGMLIDLAFAIVWVSGVSVLFAMLQGPRWAYYMTLTAGVLAYYGFFWSWSIARARARNRSG